MAVETLSRVTPTPGPSGTEAPAPRPGRRSWMWHLLLAPVALLFALPFVQMFLTALTPRAEMNKYPPRFFPAHLTLDGFARLFQESDILHWTLNTLIVSGIGVVAHPAEGTSTDDLMALAETRVEAAKRSGRNCVVAGSMQPRRQAG